jgi:rhamnosyltransferase subunit B
MMIPTAHWMPPFGPSSPNLGRPLNRASWTVLRQMTSFAFRDRKINAVRAQLGQSRLRGNAGWAWLEADRTVVLASRHYYGPGADDWPPVTWGGFSIWHGPDDQTLDPALDAHVDAGDPPVLVTLGTSAATDASEQFARIAGDLDAAGLRSVLLVGHEGNLARVADRPGAVTFAPITELLPRCRVAVVSGALGGLAAALTAGVPVVIHPQLFDQVWHGRRVEQLGVGVMARKSEDVGAAVERIVDDPSYTERARALAAAMAGEDGSRVLADAVESLLV